MSVYNYQMPAACETALNSPTIPNPAAAMKSKKKTASPSPHKPVKVRRTQAERTATMRSRIIQAAISSLSEIGYSATSTNIVAKRAGVSRGAMTHHFASKIDLMISIIDYVFNLDMEFYTRELAKFTTERERTIGMIDLAWKAFSSPGGLAVLHIMMAGPGDEELKKRLPAEMTRIANLADNIRRPGIARSTNERAVITAAVVLHRAALRGLAIELLSGTSATKIDAGLKLLKEYTAHFFDVVNAQSKTKDSKNPNEAGAKAAVS
jgi:AcrR family transcriptional regulator